MQKEKDFLKKKKLTNKELTQFVMGNRKDIITNDKNTRFIAEKVFLIEGLLNLFLEHDKEFNRIVMEKAKEFEKEQRSENTEGA